MNLRVKIIYLASCLFLLTAEFFLIPAPIGLEAEKASEQAPQSLNKQENNTSGRYPILMYHYISPAPLNSSLPGLYLEPEIFEKQLTDLKELGCETLFISEIAKRLTDKQAFPEKPVALTFDDAYADFYKYAFPLLKKHQTKATLYVIVKALDKPGYISTEQLQEMAKSGLVEIGSHTFNHPNLKNINLKKAEYEIKASRIALEQISEQKITSFAYPFGLYNASSLKLVASNYQAAVSTEAGSKQGVDNIFKLRRLRPGSRSGEEFRHWLLDWYLEK